MTGVLLAGCGGDDKATDASASASTEPATTAPSSGGDLTKSGSAPGSTPDGRPCTGSATAGLQGVVRGIDARSKYPIDVTLDNGSRYVVAPQGSVVQVRVGDRFVFADLDMQDRIGRGVGGDGVVVCP